MIPILLENKASSFVSSWNKLIGKLGRDLVIGTEPFFNSIFLGELLFPLDALQIGIKQNKQKNNTKSSFFKLVTIQS